MIPSFTRKALMIGGLVFGCLNGAKGAITVLDFEGLDNSASVGDYYNGEDGGSFGVSFSPDIVVLENYFVGAVSGANIIYVDTERGDGSIMNVGGGFTAGFSFYFVAIGESSIWIYSGLNGTGDVLGVITLPSDGVDDWTAIGVSFSGVAHSVSFADVSNAVFDDLTLGSATPGVQQVPEPSAYAAVVGVVALAAVALRRRGRA